MPILIPPEKDFAPGPVLVRDSDLERTDEEKQWFEMITAASRKKPGKQ